MKKVIVVAFIIGSFILSTGCSGNSSGELGTNSDFRQQILQQQEMQQQEEMQRQQLLEQQQEIQRQQDLMFQQQQQQFIMQQQMGMY